MIQGSGFRGLGFRVFHCDLSQQRFRFCFEAFRSLALKRSALDFRLGWQRSWRAASREAKGMSLNSETECGSWKQEARLLAEEAHGASREEAARELAEVPQCHQDPGTRVRVVRRALR